MKKISITLIYLAIAFASHAQKHYPCEKTPIGKLITKPLLKEGEIHYELMLTSPEDKRNNNPDGVGVTTDSVHNTYITRWHSLEGSDVNLLFVYNDSTKTCLYQVTEIFNDKKPMHAYRISGDGTLVNWDAKEELGAKQKIYQQREVDAMLKYFE